MSVAFRKPSAKSDLLDNAGYLYHFDLRLYINRQEKKAFSLQFLETHSEAEIEQCIKSAGANGEGWHFFFTEAPTKSFRRQLEDLLG